MRVRILLAALLALLVLSTAQRMLQGPVSTSPSATAMAGDSADDLLVLACAEVLVAAMLIGALRATWEPLPLPRETRRRSILRSRAPPVR